MTKQYDVIIVGAGMVGAAIACGLARSDLKVAVVDPLVPSPFVEGESPHIRVSAISYASEQILRNLGAWQHIEAKRICPYRRLAVNELPSNKGISALLPDISAWARTEFDASQIGQSHLGHIIENDIVHLALHEAMTSLDNVSIYCPDKIESMNLIGEQKLFKLSNAGEITSRLVVGADGAQSRVREQANLGQYKEKYSQHAFVCTVTYEGEQEDITWQSFTSHGPLAFLPLADSGDEHYASLVWYDSPKSVGALCEIDESELMEKLATAYPRELPPIKRIVERASFPLYKSHAINYVSQGVALAGDAAHTINPLAGQGVNLGFMDAAMLIEILAKAKLDGENIASLEVLQRYQKNRKPENQKMMSIMDMFYHGFSNELLPLRVMRNIGLGLANNSGPAKNKVMQYAVGAIGNLPKLAQA
jgi:2-octaprenyl-3-methyl-6-methoxy-1,4-benzoquinol hydroxylase